MEVRVLGPLEVKVNGRQVRLGPQQCVLLAVLLLEAGRVVPTSRLVELLWGEAAPERAAATLRSHVLHLRRALEPDRPAGAKPTVLVTEGAGYALRIRPEQLDAVRFEQLVDEGRAALAAGDPRTAVERLDAGLALWRGPALADVADRAFALREAARLEGLHRAARQVRIEADLVLGRHAEVLGELAGLVADQPGDEHLRCLFALALYRSHRIEEATRVCQESLTYLQERGLDSAVLQELQRDLLRGAPALDWTPPKPARPFQLPPDIAEFTGRHAELVTLRGRLLPVAGEPGRAVVISAIDGKPGIGKSALAIHLAHAIAAQFADGVLCVNLRGAEPEPLAPVQVLERFLHALGVPDQQIPGDLDAAVASYRSVLAAKQVLVVLDNAASAAQVRPLIPGNPGCAALITSRTPLADLEGSAPLTLDLLPETDAVTLLARLAGQDRVDADPASAAQVVRQCGLLPLAVRIAGARLRARPHWPLATLVVRLADERRRLGELAVGELAVRSSFLLSYQGLKPDEARMFRLLGVLSGPDATPGVAAALTQRASAEVGATLERLVDAQLVETPTPGRYRLHDLLRLFAREQVEADETEPARRAALERALGWYLATAGHANELLMPTSMRPTSGNGSPFEDQHAALAWLEAERANLVAVAKHAAEHTVAAIVSVAWRLSDTLWRFFDLRKHWADWQDVSEAALRAARRADNAAAAARQLSSLGMIAREQRRFEEAITYQEQSLTVCREFGSRDGEATALNSLGIIFWQQQRLDEAVACFEQCLTLHRELGDREGEDKVLNNLGNVFAEQQRFDEAIACLEQSLAISREIGGSARRTLNSLGDLYRSQGRTAEAIAGYEQSLAICRQVGDRHTEASNLRKLGLTIQAVQGVHAARAYWADALAIFTELGAPEVDELRALLNAIPASTRAIR